MVAKENDDVGNLLLFVFVVLNDDDEDKNTSLEEEEEEEKVQQMLLFIVVVAIRPRSACLIITKSLKNNAFRYNGEESDFWKHLSACTQNGPFSFPSKKKEITFSVFTKEAIDSSETTQQKDTKKAWRLLMLLLLIVLG